jgi:ABC-2 type transport system permease protein
LRKLVAFVRRDLAVAASYRFLWLFQVANVVFFVGALFFLGQLVDSGGAPAMAPYASYFSFGLVGVAVTSFFFSSMSRLLQNLRESQINGTLEAILITGTSPFAILLYSYAAILLLELAQWAAYLGIGVGAFGFSLAQAHWACTTVLCALGILLFLGFALISASFILVFKRGDPFNWILGGAAWLISGALYPVELLPAWLQEVSRVYPVTPLLGGLRRALLLGDGFGELRPELLTVGASAVAMLALGAVLFRWALGRARREGSLAHY